MPSHEWAAKSWRKRSHFKLVEEGWSTAAPPAGQDAAQYPIANGPVRAKVAKGRKRTSEIARGLGRATDAPSASGSGAAWGLPVRSLTLGSVRANSLPYATDAEGDGADGEKGEVLSKIVWTAPKTTKNEWIR